MPASAGEASSLASLEEEQMQAIVNQLDNVAKALTGEKIEAMVGDFGLDRLYSLLHPPTSVHLTLFELQLGLAKKQKTLAELKRSVQKVTQKTEELQSNVLEVKAMHETLASSLAEAEAEMGGSSIEELQHASKSYDREINAERAVCNSLSGLNGVYSGEKLDAGMDRVRVLMAETAKLKKELHFAPILPPNLSEARVALQGRKDHLADLMSRIQDLTSSSP